MFPTGIAAARGHFRAQAAEFARLAAAEATLPHHGSIA
jgi:hypothetical protein